MQGRIGIILAVFVAVLSIASIASATTVTCPSSETITIGSLVLGSYSDLCVIDGSKEVLKEGLGGGVSKLQVQWSFPSVPAGNQVLHYWGTRPTNAEGDNYQFYVTDRGTPFGILIFGAIINHPFAPNDGIRIPLWNTTTTKNFTVFLADTNENSGTILDSVTLDCVTIETTP